MANKANSPSSTSGKSLLISLTNVQNIINHFSEFSQEWNQAGKAHRSNSADAYLTKAWAAASEQIKLQNRSKLWGNLINFMWKMPGSESVGATIALDAITALLAWDNANELLHMPVYELQALVDSDNQAAQLMLSAAWALTSTTSVSGVL